MHASQRSASDAFDLPPRPYPGLRPFRTDEQAIFFGRRRQFVRMLNILKRQHFLAVVGTSGCGKSSLVKAGLLPELTNPRFRVGETDKDWVHVVARPGGGPYRNLAAKLAATPFERAKTDPAWKNVVDGLNEIDTGQVERRLRAGSNGLVDAIYSVPGMASRNVLIVIDQFEEIFRFGDTSRTSISELERTGLHDDALAFVNTLLSAVDEQHPNIYVAITMRSDSLGRCDLFHRLPEAITRCQFLPPRMTKPQLLDAIRGPLQAYDSTIDDAVVSDLLEAMGDRQDQLPVVQHALAQLWEFASAGKAKDAPRHITKSHADRCRSTHDSRGRHERLAWVSDAISTHADSILDSLSDNVSNETRRLREHIARVLFCALTQIDNNEEPERRLSSVREVASYVFDTDLGSTPEPEHLAAVGAVVEEFAAEGDNFIFQSTTTGGKEALDVSHESLLRQWQTFRNWLSDEQKSAADFRRLRDAALAYERMIDGKRQGDLLPPATLESLETWWDREMPTAAWAGRYSAEPHDFTLAREFLRTSRTAENKRKEAERQARRDRQRLEREARQAEERRLKAEAEAAKQLAAEQEAKARSRRRWLVGVWTVAILAVVASGVAIWFARAAQDAQATAEKAGADALKEKQKADDNAELAEKQKQVAVKQTIRATQAEKRAVSQKRRIEKLLYVNQIRFAESAWERGDVTEAWSHLNASQWNRRHWEHDYLYSKFTAAQTTLQGHTNSVLSVSFSPDGERIVSGSLDNTLKVWDAETGQETLTLKGHSGPVWSVSFSPDGERIVSGSDDNTLKVWDAETGQETLTLKGHTASVWSVSFSPDGERIVSGSGTDDVDGKSGEIWIWDARSGDAVRQLTGHKDTVLSVAFDSSGQRVVSGGADRTLRFWDADSGAQLLSLNDDGYVFGARFDPSGKNRVVTGSGDGTVKVWLQARHVAASTGPVEPVPPAPDPKTHGPPPAEPEPVTPTPPAPPPHVTVPVDTPELLWLLIAVITLVLAVVLLTLVSRQRRV